MGKSKGGGGGTTGVGKIGIPPAIASSGPSSLSQNVYQPLGTFGAEEMLGLGGLANWAANLATGGNVQTGGTLPYTGLLPGGGTKTFAPFTTSGTTGGTGLNPFTGAGTNFLSGLNAQQLGPFLANAVQNLLNAEGTTSALGAPAETLLSQGAKELATGNRMLGQATGKAGLFPSQEAMIQQAVATEQTQIGQQLASEGLGSSTLLKSLQGQAALSGAATGGQLIQSNIQLAQTEQQMGTQATAGGAQIEEAMSTQFSNIASMSTALQQSLWNQAIQGYGQLGNFMNGILAAFGYSLKTQEDVLQANEAAAGFQVQEQQLAAQAAEAQSQGFTNLLGALGGSSGGGSSGGLLGGLGGLLGSAGAGIGGAGAGAFGTVGGLASGAASAGAAGSLGSLGTGIIGALGGLLAAF